VHACTTEYLHLSVESRDVLFIGVVCEGIVALSGAHLDLFMSICQCLHAYGVLC
jgi:hypothetical protein